MPEPSAKRWHAAIRDNEVSAVRECLDQGMDPNAAIEDATPLTLAAMFGRYEAAVMLLDAGADVNRPSAYNQETPIFPAAGMVIPQKRLLVLIAYPVTLRN